MRVLVAGTETAAAHIRATGLVASQEEARLGFKTGGVITAMLVDAGDRVQRGQTLARLDATELEGAVRQAAAHQERAARDVSRAEKLYEQGVIAEQQVQDASTQLAVLNATLAWVIIGGLLSSTFLARLVTPVMYLVMAPPLRPPVDDETA